MDALAFTTALISSLFRICTYLFLRVVPARPAKVFLPSLYFMYLTALWLTPSPACHKDNPAHDTKGGSPDSNTQTTSPPKHRTYLEPLAAVLLSWPSPRISLRLTNLIINTVLLLAAADFAFYPLLDDASDATFTRVGALYPDSAKIVVRYPLHNATERHLRVSWKQAAAGVEESSWNDGPLLTLAQDADWVGTTRLAGLWPKTSYEYRLKDVNGTVLPHPPKPIHFSTFPDPRLPTGSHFRFLASSCVTPNFPYVPLHGRRIKGFDLLFDYLWPMQPASSPQPELSASAGGESIERGFPEPSEPSNLSDLTTNSSVAQPPAEFMLFLGDFVYADVPVYFGENKEAYRRLYRRNYQSDSFRKVYERLPIFHIYDDHEIINNFIGMGNDSTPPYMNASDAFRLYHAEANYDSPESGQYYYNFSYADTAFFVTDTRRYRSDILSEEPAARSMLGDKQLAALYDWLGKVNTTATFKFIVTSVPFTSLWQHDALLDSWAAYAYEKAALLSALHSVPNVILISGDRHEFAAVEFNGEGHNHKILEISTSPLSMFYVPFFRTLRQKSEGVVRHIKDIAQTTSEAQGQTVEEVPQERVLKYIPVGNYKWSSFEVDTRNPNKPVVQLEVAVDGSPVYRLTIDGRPVDIHPTTALGTLIPQHFKGILDKIGFKPSRWF